MSGDPLVSDTSTTPIWASFKGIALSLSVLAFFVVFGFWSGVPKGERALVFWIGVELLALVLMTFSWMTWHLLFRPLPVEQTIRAQPMSASYRQAMALLLSVGGFGLIVGAFWDEIWHRQYGTPFGEDFFWRPHVLIYFGILVAIALALAGLYRIMRWGQGTLQQRFRANPVMSIAARERFIVTFREKASSGIEHPQTQQIEFGTPIRAALDQLQTVDLALELGSSTSCMLMV